MNEVIQRLRRTLLVHDGAGLTDGQLLESFISHHEEAAVAALVRRHGPMVWAVCRRVLCNHHDAEDAFQATFLVMVRKARSIRPREKVANWLYGVARQVAVKARAMLVKRQKREKQAMGMQISQVHSECNRQNDVQLLLDQELSRLPEKYRVVIVLCDLEDKPYKEVASQLKKPEGTIATRLMRARAMLAKRLARHGLAVTGSSLAMMFSHEMASASVPVSLMSSAIQAVGIVATGKATTGTISTNVTTLAEGMVQSILLKKLTNVTALILGLMALASGIWAWSAMGDKHTSDKLPEQQTPVDQPNAATSRKADLKVQKTSPKYFTNKIGMKFVWIPPGTFVMGSPKQEKGRHENEIQHKVTLTKGIYMGVHAVGLAEWSDVPKSKGFRARAIILNERDLPVTAVEWNECQEYVADLRKMDNKPYRLPTEAEWEYACRAGTTTPYHFGEKIPEGKKNDKVEKDAFELKTTRGKILPPNAWGLHDMHGNVRQWCEDWFDDYPRQDVVDPTGPKNENNKLMYRVARGGSFALDPAECRSASRRALHPIEAARSQDRNQIGFRICFFAE